MDILWKFSVVVNDLPQPLGPWPVLFILFSYRKCFIRFRCLCGHDNLGVSWNLSSSHRVKLITVTPVEVSDVPFPNTLTLLSDQKSFVRVHNLERSTVVLEFSGVSEVGRR